MMTGMLTLGLGYYFLVKPSEYSANFAARTSPGDVIETIRLWNKSLDNAAIVDVDSFSTLSQRIIHDGREYIYTWKFRTADSVTKVDIDISEPGKVFLNKLLVPFVTRPIEQDASKIVREFFGILKTHLEITKVNIVGVVDVDEKFCVCSTVQTLQVDKANGMMRDFLPLSTFVEEMELTTDGPPIVKVSHWNHSKGSLEFDFCFPIKNTLKLPHSKVFSYRSLPSQRALKADYFGNYVTSDRAWYELIQFARDQNYQITGLPIEVFHNNPNLGMNEKEWRAEIFLPVADVFRDTAAD